MLKINGPKTACLALVMLIGLLVTATVGAAQTGSNLRISPPEVDDFPSVSLNVSVSDDDGRRVNNLPPSSFQIVENGVALNPSSVNEIEAGTRQLFIINTNEAMGLRDASGRTRLFFARQALLDWLTQPDASQFASDDLTLVTGTGALVEHGSASATLASTLSQYQPEFSPEQANFELLLDSLSYLADESAQSSTPSFVMFFTTLIGADQELALTNVIARAQELGAAIFPIVINPPQDAAAEALVPLTQLAQETNGRIFILDPETTDLAELRQQIIAQRVQYQIAYSSQANQSGEQQIIIRLSSPTLIAESQPRTFDIQVQPPQVTFIQPPSQIERASEDPSVPLEMLPPTERPLELLITYPDNHPRPIVSSQLLANGQVVSQRSQPPFDQFNWDLSGYAQDEQVELQAVVTDSLGLEGSTMAQPIQILVEPPPGGLAALRPALLPLGLIIGLLVVAVVGAVALLTMSRRSSTPAQAEPEQQPAVRPLSRARLQHPSQGQAEAFLIPLLGDEQGEPIPLTGVDITLGADASLAAYPLRDASVSGLHARLIRQAGGDYLLRDQGSLAGTWVNFQPVPEQGLRLKNGDQINLGRVALRFMLSAPAKPPTTRIEKLRSISTGEPRNEDAS